MDQGGIWRHGHFDLLELILRAGADLDDRVGRRVECFDRIIDVEAGHRIDVVVAVESRANVISRERLLLRVERQRRQRRLDARLGDCSWLRLGRVAFAVAGAVAVEGHRECAAAVDATSDDGLSYALSFGAVAARSVAAVEVLLLGAVVGDVDVWLLVERGEGRRDETVSDCVETAALGGWNLLVVDSLSLLNVVDALKGSRVL